MWYDIIKQSIDNGGYKLDEVTKKIKRLWIMGDLSEEQMTELLGLAQSQSNIDDERPEILVMIQALTDRIEDIEKTINEGAITPPSTDPDNPDTPVYEDWAPWDGVSKKYQYGSIVRHNDKLWISTFMGQNVWEPGVYGWEEYTISV